MSITRTALGLTYTDSTNTLSEDVTVASNTLLVALVGGGHGSVGGHADDLESVTWGGTNLTKVSEQESGEVHASVWCLWVSSGDTKTLTATWTNSITYLTLAAVQLSASGSTISPGAIGGTINSLSPWDLVATEAAHYTDRIVEACVQQSTAAASSWTWPESDQDTDTKGQEETYWDRFCEGYGVGVDDPPTCGLSRTGSSAYLAVAFAEFGVSGTSYERSANDTLAISDSVATAASYSHSRSASDTLEISDSAAATRSRVFSVELPGDTIAITDAVLREADQLRAISEDYYVSVSYDGKVGSGSGWFGQAVAVNGNWMAVTDRVNTGPGYVYMFLWTNGRWVYKQALTGSDCATGDRFGNSVDIHGDTMVVGDYYKSSGGYGGGGVAYVFTVDANYVWSQQQKLEAGDPSTNKWFGVSVAVCGDWIVCGAGADGSTGSGWAYTFKRTTGVWAQVDKLTPSDGGIGDGFGGSRDRGSRAVSICKKTGTTLAIGSFGHGHSGYQSDSGGVYVYTCDGSNWSIQQEVLPDVNLQQQYFGDNVHVDGDTLVVSGAGSSFGATSYPSVSVYTRSGSTWTWQQRMEYADANARGAGNCPAVNENTGWIALALPACDLGGTNYGAVFFYKKIGSSYALQKYIARTSNTGSFGYGSLSMDSQGTRAAVGHYTTTVNANTQLYTFGSGCFEITEQLSRDDSKTTITVGDSLTLTDGVSKAVQYERFGFDPAYAFSKESYQLVDFSTEGDFYCSDFDGSDILYIGHPAYNANEGRVLVYQRSGTNSWSLLRTISNPDAPSKTLFGSSVSASGGSVAIGGPNKTVGAYANNGSVHVYTDYGVTHQQEVIPAYQIANLIIGYRARVILSGDRLFIGNPLRSVGGWYYGAISPWTRTGGVWSEGTEIIGPWGGHTYFGTRMAFDTTSDSLFGQSGSNGPLIAIYRWVTGAWTRVQSDLDNNNGGAAIGGVTLSAGQDTFAVTGSLSGGNPVNIWKRNSGTDTWQFFKRLTVSYSLDGGYHGQRIRVSANGKNIVVCDPASASYTLRLFSEDNHWWAQELAMAPDTGVGYFYYVSGIGVASDDSLYLAAFDNNNTSSDLEIFHVTRTHTNDISDSVTKQVAYGRQISDTAVVADSVLRSQSAVRSASDTLTLADSSSRSLEADRWAADSLGLADEAQAQLFLSVIEREVDDTSIEVVDIVRRSAEFGRTPFYPNVVLYVEIKD